MKARDVMFTYVFACRGDDSVVDCARLMRDERIGFVPVVDDEERVIGVITDRDLVVRLLADACSPHTSVAQVMSSGDLLTCSADDELAVVEEAMARKKKSRALVLDAAGRCEGVISLSDIAVAEEPSRAGELLRDVVRRESTELSHFAP